MENQNESAPCTNFVPHDKIRDTIIRIENLKAANEYISLFLPTWIDDK
jgi:hypothetical protein